MDQPGLDAAIHRQALDGLTWVNAISRTAKVLWQGLQTVDALSSEAPLRILDIGAGGGDIVVGLAKLARRHNVTLEVDGCDINPTAIFHAEASARRAGVPESRFFQ